MANIMFRSLLNKKISESNYKNAFLATSYFNNIDKRLNLDTYLFAKPILPSDFLRYVYSKIMTASGIADTYRNEQFLKKPDFQYDLERFFIFANFNNTFESKNKFPILLEKLLKTK